jgi:hypothetical protein
VTWGWSVGAALGTLHQVKRASTTNPREGRVMTALTLLLTAAMTRCVALLASASAILTRKPRRSPRKPAAPQSSRKPLLLRLPQAPRGSPKHAASSCQAPRPARGAPGRPRNGQEPRRMAQEPRRTEQRSTPSPSASTAPGRGTKQTVYQHPKNLKESQRISKNVRSRPGIPGRLRNAQARQRTPPKAAARRGSAPYAALLGRATRRTRRCPRRPRRHPRSPQGLAAPRRGGAGGDGDVSYG